MRILSLDDAIGNTPLLNISTLFPMALEKNIHIWIKLERQNPGGSIKDRVAKSLIETAEDMGLLSPETVIIEPTSGNTGIGLAMICAIKGYKLILTMPDTMSVERRKILELYGATLVLTEGKLGMKGAISKANELAEKEQHSFIPMQFKNPANPDSHFNSTAQELIADLPSGIDFVVCGVGTGGHITGISQYFKLKMPQCQFIAVEPQESSILSGGAPGPHKIQGIGAGFVPDVLNLEAINKIIPISSQQAINYFLLTPKTIGLSIGISTGANLAAVESMLNDIPENSTIVTFCYDTAEKYLSMAL